MKKKKRSFFERLTGAAQEEDFDFDENEFDEEYAAESKAKKFPVTSDDDYFENEKTESIKGELSVDVINTPNEIVIKAMVAGVRPQNLDVQISRDMVTIEGKREEESEISEQDYYHRELYWGAFSRNILLPEEIDVELSEARERHGLLEIHLPKIDKARKAKLQVKSN